MKAGKFLFVLFLTATLLSHVCSVREKFDGHKVYEVTPGTKDQIKALKGILALTDDNGEGIFARKNFRLDKVTDVLVHPSALSKLTGLAGLTSTELSTTVAPEIDWIPEPGDTMNGETDAPWDNYQSIDTIEEWIEKTVKSHPKIARLDYIGGARYRNLILVTISSQLEAGTKLPGVFILAGTNPGNMETTSAACYIINELLDVTLASSAELRKNHIFYILPLFNPDGLEYFQRTGILTTKNRSTPKAAGGKCPGVNLAVNFDVNWNVGVGATDAEKDQCNPYFAGDAACSEPECQIVTKFILNHTNIHSFFDLQQNTQSWLYPEAAASDKSHKGLEAISKRAVNEMKRASLLTFAAESIATFETEAHGGLAVDWAYQVAKIKYAFMVNSRDPAVFLHLFVPPTELVEVGREVWAGIQVAMKDADPGFKKGNADTIHRTIAGLLIFCWASVEYITYKM